MNQLIDLSHGMSYESTSVWKAVGPGEGGLRRGPLTMFAVGIGTGRSNSHIPPASPGIYHEQCKGCRHRRENSAGWCHEHATAPTQLCYEQEL